MYNFLDASNSHNFLLQLVKHLLRYDELLGQKKTNNVTFYLEAFQIKIII